MTTSLLKNNFVFLLLKNTIMLSGDVSMETMPWQPTVGAAQNVYEN